MSWQEERKKKLLEDYNSSKITKDRFNELVTALDKLSGNNSKKHKAKSESVNLMKKGENDMIVTTSSTIPGYEINKHIDIVTRSNYFHLIDQTEENINKYIFITEENMLEEMKNEVYATGGDALINFVVSKAVVPVSYVTTNTGIWDSGSTVHFLYGVTISMSGTAVTLNKRGC